MSKPQNITDVCIIGGGLVGKSATLALANAGLDVTLCALPSTVKDQRTTALLMDSVAFFQDLGIWDVASGKAYPLKTMRIVDDTSRLIRAPQVDFSSKEIGIEAFGYNVLNHEFSDILDKEIDKHPSVVVVEAGVEDIQTGDSTLVVKTADPAHHIRTRFLVGADGRNSMVRNRMNAGEKVWKYPQTAIVLDFKHQYSSRYTSTEFHTETGPFTIVPRNETTAGLVWMETPARAAEIIAQSRDELAHTLERQMQSFLGKVEPITHPRAFPLQGLVARQFGNDNWVLIGEAAHVFPPIGAQGFNLGIRDIETLVDVLGRFTSDENCGKQYALARNGDINMRTIGVDLLNRSLISGFLPLNLLRGIGLHALGNIPLLRKTVMKMGISPQFHASKSIN